MACLQIKMRSVFFFFKAYLFSLKSMKDSAFPGGASGKERKKESESDVLFNSLQPHGV